MDENKQLTKGQIKYRKYREKHNQYVKCDICKKLYIRCNKCKHDQSKYHKLIAYCKDVLNNHNAYNN